MNGIFIFLLFSWICNLKCIISVTSDASVLIIFADTTLMALTRFDLLFLDSVKSGDDEECPLRICASLETLEELVKKMC